MVPACLQVLEEDSGPAGNAVEASPRGEPLKCGVKNVRGVVDDLGLLAGRLPEF